MPGEYSYLTRSEANNAILMSMIGFQYRFGDSTDKRWNNRIIKEEEGKKLTFGSIVNVNLDTLSGHSLKEESNRIEEYQKLEEDWDSYGAERIDEEVISAACEIINTFLYEDDDEIYKLNIDSAPLANGGIDLYIENLNRYIQIELNPSDEDSYILMIDKDVSDQEEAKETIYIYEKLSDYINWLFSRGLYATELQVYD